MGKQRSLTNKLLILFFIISLLPIGITFTSPNNKILPQEILNESFIQSYQSNFSKFLLITWDGVRTKWIEEYSTNEVLAITKQLRDEGREVYLKLLDQSSSTDPCLAVIETGFGPKENKILANTFGAGPAGPRIPNGFQTSERFKSFFGDEYKIGHINSWAHHFIENSTYGLPDGHIARSDSTDTLFLNARPGIDVDFWFGSENVTWIPENEEAHQASLEECWKGTYIDGGIEEGILTPEDPESYNSYGYIERFSNVYNKTIKYWLNPLLSSDFLAKQAIHFLNQYSNENFYLRVHMTEPDYWGHKYGESIDQKFNMISPEYLRTLIECDNATGKILNELKSLGIFNETFVLVGSDHGFLGHSHSEEPILYISNQQIWRNTGDESIGNAYGLEHDIQPTLLALAGVDWESINYQSSMPIFIREYGSALKSSSTTANLEQSTTNEKPTTVSVEIFSLGLSLFYIQRKKKRH